MSASNPVHTKEKLRAQYLNKRKQLNLAEFEQLNHGLLEQVETLDIRHSRTIHIFLSITDKFEPDTFGMIEAIRRQHPQTRWVTSTVAQNNIGLYHFELDHLTLLRKSKWGIPEPIGGYLVPEHEIDLIFIPLLVVDQAGHRVGYGKGFYDRFLSKCRADALKVGISLFEPIPKITDPAPWDIPLDACITPSGTYWFNSASQKSI